MIQIGGSVCSWIHVAEGDDDQASDQPVVDTAQPLHPDSQQASRASLPACSTLPAFQGTALSSADPPLVSMWQVTVIYNVVIFMLSTWLMCCVPSTRVWCTSLTTS